MKNTRYDTDPASQDHFEELRLLDAEELKAPEAETKSTLIKDPEAALAFTRSELAPYAGANAWVFPNSGGKDSRSTIQSALVLIKRGCIEPPQRIIQVMADTMMEFKDFKRQAVDSIKEMEDLGHSLGIEMITRLTTPNVHDDFWTRIIGRGFVPPTEHMRTCTDQLKIKPIRKALKALNAQAAPTMIGVRYGESGRRDQVLACTVGGECGPDFMTRHRVTQVKVTPIVRWRQCAVWDFLTFIAPSELGVNNQPLIDAYGGLGGNLRYGCWSCPLIFDDKTAKAQKNPLYADLLTWTNANLRVGGEAWKSHNREYRETGDGLLSLEYCKRLLEQLQAIEGKHGVALLEDWQLAGIYTIWKWRARLHEGQKGHALQASIITETTARPREYKLHISQVRPKSAVVLAHADLRSDPYHETIRQHAQRILHVTSNGDWIYTGQIGWENPQTVWHLYDCVLGERIITVDADGIRE